jgi:hypothetical protein
MDTEFTQCRSMGFQTVRPETCRRTRTPVSSCCTIMLYGSIFTCYLSCTFEAHVQGDLCSACCLQHNHQRHVPSQRQYDTSNNKVHNSIVLAELSKQPSNTGTAWRGLACVFINVLLVSLCRYLCFQIASVMTSCGTVSDRMVACPAQHTVTSVAESSLERCMIFRPECFTHMWGGLDLVMRIPVTTYRTTANYSKKLETLGAPPQDRTNFDLFAPLGYNIETIRLLET